MDVKVTNGALLKSREFAFLSQKKKKLMLTKFRDLRISAKRTVGGNQGLASKHRPEIKKRQTIGAKVS